MKNYVLPAKQVPVTNTADVVVCGGGTAGVVAAIAAAREGMSVVIIEQFGSLGGSATNSLVTPLMHTHIPGNPQCSYIAEEINRKIAASGFADPSGRIFDPLSLRFVLEDMATEAGVKLLYHTYISDVVKDGTKLLGIVAENKSGRQVIEGKMFIDCTGDGDVSVLSGADYEKGNPELDGKCQPISLRYIVGGVDIAAFGEFINSEKTRTGATEGGSWNGKSIYAAVTGKGVWTLTDLFDKAIAAGDLVTEDKLYWQMFEIPGRFDCLAFNNPEFFDKTDGTDPDTLTETQVLGKKAILRQLNFYKKYCKGFEKAYIAEISNMVGIRESRNIKAEYMLSANDLLSRAKFDDAICRSNYPIDIHGRTLNCHLVAPVDDKPYYEIPYRSLVVKGIDNLFVAGRCLGAEFLAQSSLRIQPSCRSAGEAAGIAAAFAIKDGVLPKDIDGRRVRKEMEDRGANFQMQNA